ncbi:hypothetical protein ABT369_21810 [Dactylosporangium sp. NPDC000244]|uniref:hypothetical protein n=1 Tax=Dactylosporangium sp. NPDC000244 TaxID=3154365 RepID=UPI0033340E97
MPPSLDCVSSLPALRAADLREVAAAVLWLGFGHKRAQARPVLNLLEVQATIARKVPEVAIRMLRSGPSAEEAREILLEALQVLEHNRLVLWRWTGEDYTAESIALTRRGREALASADLGAYIA